MPTEIIALRKSREQPCVLSRQARIVDRDIRRRDASDDDRAPLVELGHVGAVAVKEHQRRSRVNEAIPARNGRRQEGWAFCAITQVLLTSIAVSARRDNAYRWSAGCS